MIYQESQVKLILQFTYKFKCFAGCKQKKTSGSISKDNFSIEKHVENFNSNHWVVNLKSYKKFQSGPAFF